MKQLLLTYLNMMIFVSFLVLLLFAGYRFFKKYLSALCLYSCCILLLFGFLIPIRPFAKWSFFTVPTPRVDTKDLQTEQDIEPMSNVPINRSTNTNFTSTKGNTGIDASESKQANDSASIIEVIKDHPYWFLFIFWFSGALCTFVYHLLRHTNRKKTLLRMSKPIDDLCYQQLLSDQRLKLHIQRTISFRTSSLIGSPLTIGVTSHTILLPSCTYSKEELCLLLQHELIHIKRHDLFLQWCLLLCLSIHWYNPIVYLFVALWKDLCENSCDQLVLQDADVPTRMQYGQLLLKTAQNHNQISQLLIITFYGGKKRMKKRLESILDTKKKKAGIVTLGLFAFLLCTTSIFSFAKETQSPQEADNPSEIASTPVEEPEASASTDLQTEPCESPIATDDSQVESVESQAATDDSQVESVESQAATVDSQVESVESQAATVDSQVESTKSQAATVDSQVESVESQAATVDSQVESVESQTAFNDSQVESTESTADRDQFVQTVLTFEGSAYIYGGSSPEEGFDSSGLTQYLYSLVGYQLPRTCREQYTYATPIQESDLQPGDLVFYYSETEQPNHVGIYIGNGEVLHASNPKNGVKRSAIDYRKIYGYGAIFQ